MSFNKKQFIIEAMKLEDGDVLIVHVNIDTMPRQRAEQHLAKLRDSMKKWLAETNKKVELILAPMNSEKKKIQIEKFELGKLNIIRDDVTGMNPTQVNNYLVGVYRFLVNNDVMKKTPVLVLPTVGFDTAVNLETLDTDVMTLVETLCTRIKEQDGETRVSIENFMQSKKAEIEDLASRVASLRKEYTEEFDKLTRLKSNGLPKDVDIATPGIIEVPQIPAPEENQPETQPANEVPKTDEN